MKRIFVIIPVYNAKEFLRETVLSVLNQPYKEIEIILIDDGSTDGSSEVCDELAAKEERITVIHQKNAGVSAARNTGIRFVTSRGIDGDYMAFLDADDLWRQNVVDDEVVSKMNNNIDVVMCGSISSNENCSVFSKPLLYEEHICSGGEGVIWPMCGHFGANFYSIDLIKKWNICFVEGLKYAEDKIFKMQCVFLAEKVMYLPQILHIYRENNNSAMRKVFSYTPIEYYIPIINGWIKSDDFINSMEEKSCKHIDAGYTLASIYFGDMAVEHFKRWKSRKSLCKVCDSHPYFKLFENMDPKAVSVKQYRNQQLFFQHPLLFALKYRVIGMAEYFARLLLRTKPMYNFRIKRKYPLDEIPSID